MGLYLFYGVSFVLVCPQPLKSKVCIGFIGILILVYNELLISSYNLLFVSFVIIAAFCYAINANILKYKLPGIPAIALVFMSFVFLFIPAFIILILSDFPISEFIYAPDIIESIVYTDL